ncbi:MAG: vitamin B12 dependent methionine synthase [Anaerolineae bacterium]|nr:vitamin B12 dependent methionine synthase [Anaerolineae bacterium]
MRETDQPETPFVLDDIPFAPALAPLKKRLRIKDGSRSEAELAALLPAAAAIAKPKALYRLVYIDEKAPEAVTLSGVTLHSRILRVNLEAAHRAIVYVVTCGTELHAWGEGLDDMVHQYWADTIKEMALGAAIQTLHAHLAACYELGKTAAMSPGSLADWPIREQRPLFKLLGDPEAAIGVKLTESFLMIPNKSVSGIRFPTEESFESCQLCPRESCPGRRAAYEPDLYDMKYQ